MTREKQISMLWDEYIFFGQNDKRCIEEYFSDEFGITLNKNIKYEQVKFLCDKLIGGKNV